MSEPFSAGGQALESTLGRRIDWLCDRFEAAWQADQRPRIEDYLAEVSEPERLALLSELLALELTYRRRGGERLSPEEDRPRFPQGGELIEATFTRMASLRDADVQASLTRLGGAPADPAATGSDPAGRSTATSPRFRILRPHARGGLGAVFVALDNELHREVALKQILDRHADDPVSRARFLLEAEVTGGLEHPGIVPVYGLGTYGDGRPYYAMRFVRGESLKEAIDRFHADEALRRDLGQRSLELRKLLRRFTDVCNAIDYAHSRGVLHRDIKPSNVIVGKHGETLVVDWGLAKATGWADPNSDEPTLLPNSPSGSSETLPGSALGTPAYMSPEQARGDLEHLGPRSDVYSLGATLYCLLTGKPPLEGDDIGELLGKAERGEFSRPRHHDATIDAALEAVCLKAMALRPADRYGSCRALAEDIERWMADEPVSAWREPVSRRARRWAWRHRTAVSGAAAAVLAGLIGLAAVAVVQIQFNRELKTANAKTSRALEAETKARNDTREALAQSEEARQRAEAVLGFLKDDVLAAARPKGQEGGLGVEVTVRQAVDAAEPKIAGAFRDQPIVEAEVRDTLGGTYFYLGEAPLAIRQQERALELRQTRLGPDHPDTLSSRNNLALAYLAAGRIDDALKMFEATLKQRESKLGPDHPNTLISRDNLAVAYQDAGRTDEAIMLHEVALKQSESKLGPDHPDTLASRNNLALAYKVAGRLADVLPLHEKTLKLVAAKLGPDHPDTLISRNNLARAYQAAGRLNDALPLFEGTLKELQAKLGPDHPSTLQIMNNLAGAYLDARRWAEAERTARECLSLLQKKQPEGWLRLHTMSQLGAALAGQKKYAEAEPLLLQGYEGMKARAAKVPAPRKAGLTEAAERVVGLYEAWGRKDQAAAWRAKLGKAPAQAKPKP
jgi:tetratricopeptide (TPR) repeat protein/tRNA A-37 threonylcarbamoyl transferase component Bud32